MSYGNQGGAPQKKVGSGVLFADRKSQYSHLTGNVLGGDGQEYFLNATFKVPQQGWQQPLPPNAQAAVDQIMAIMEQAQLRLTITQGKPKQQQQPQQGYQQPQGQPQGGYQPPNQQFPQGGYPPPPQGGYAPPPPQGGYAPHPQQGGGYAPHPQQGQPQQGGFNLNGGQNGGGPQGNLR